MDKIFGVFIRSSNHIYSENSTLFQKMTNSFGAQCAVWSDSNCGIGQSFQSKTFPERHTSRNGIFADQYIPFFFVGRLDNRVEIASSLGISFTQTELVSDSELIHRAYCKWGERCTERIYGDWSFVAWHSHERRLFLARDHFGITSLYYHAARDVFAFATSQDVLLNLGLFPKEMNELYLAQVLTCWPAYHGEQTIHSHIRRLPPAHRLTITPDKITIQQYWYLEKTPQLHMPKREDYVEAFREVFDEAVKVRLRTANASEGIASTLSGGLDSGSVTAIAAGFLAKEGMRLAAYTSVPLYDTASYVNGPYFGDEYPLAEAVAHFSGNVDIKAISSVDCSPIQAIRTMLQIRNAPAHSAGNFFWMLELWRIARANGNKVLLLGQFGNAGVSWTGDVYSQSLLFQFRQIGWRTWSKERLKRSLPQALLKAWRNHRANPLQHYRNSAINPVFAERLNLFERRFNDTAEQVPRTSIDQRSFVQPGKSIVGALHAELGAAFGLDVRDPTADARVLAFTFSVPDNIFIDPHTGMNRWLIREAMKGRLPDRVRLNRNTGQQAGDLVPRLRASAGEVEAALNELSCGPAAEYVDVPYMRQVWQMIQTHDTPEAQNASVKILTRGIMAGLFVNDFYA